MDRRAPFSLIAWITAVTLLALLATWYGPGPLLSTPLDWAALVLLALCAGVAHRFPVPAALQGASFRLTHVFIVAGVAVLPIGLLTPLAVIAISPDLWFRRHRPRVLLGWLFNVAQTALSAHVAATWIHAVGGAGRLDTASDLFVLLTGGILFMLVQEILVAVVVALDSRTPLNRSALFTQPTLISNGLVCVFGITVGGLWMARPILLVLIIPLLVMAYRLARSAHLAQLAEVDAKTGLHNSAHFERALQEEIQRCKRLNRPMAVVFADLDFFKRINDTWGHDAGDRVLRAVADRLATEARRGDVVARFGGEEFVLLLPATDPEEALYVAERLRAVIADQPFEVARGVHVPCTMSLGVGVFPHHGADAAALLRVADRAMYSAKSSRNTVRMATPEVGDRPFPSTKTDPRGVLASAPEPTLAAPDWRANVVVWGTVGCGLLAIVASSIDLVRTGDWVTLGPWLALAVLGELLSVRVHDTEGHQISFSFAVVVAMAAVVVHPAGAPVVSLAGAITHIARSRQRDWIKRLFNLANPSFASAGALAAYAAAVSLEPTFLDTPIVAPAAAAAAYYTINMGTIAFVVSAHTRRRFVSVLTESAWFTPTKIFFGLTGAFVGAAFDRFGPAGTAMFLAPLLILRFTLAFYASRSQRALDKLRLLNSQLTSEVARRQQSEQSLDHQANFDGLTGLANRLQLREHLSSMCKVDCFALLLLDVDRFKEVNDTFGHRYGDDLLREIGQRLRGTVRAEDVVARLGGDEFAVLLPHTDAPTASVRAHAVLECFQQPFAVGGYSIHVGASLGLALSPEHGEDPETLFRRADVALYLAKKDRRSPVVYDPARDEYSPEKLAMVGELQQAIEQGMLTLHYQPKVALEDGAVVGVEALVRWIHPRLGNIPPDVFVPLAEHTGLIGQLTTWVLDTAVAQCRTWLNAGYAIPMAVNLSAHDCENAHLPEIVAAALSRHQLPATYLRVEITEGAMLVDAERALALFNRLRQDGVCVSIDDFGTGYSSLTYLKRFPIDELKLDRSFIRDLSANSVDEAIVRSTVQLGHDIGLKLVAEGVEDAATWAHLRRLGCDIAQGFYASRALPAEEFLKWFEQESRLAMRRAA